LLEIILQVKDKNAKKELAKVDKQLDNVEKSAKDSSKGIKGFNADLLKMGAIAAGAVAGAVALGKALWNLGKRGAVVEQTEESFKGLLKQWNIAPELLEDLRKASRGTVDDMTLMSSTLTLVAGTSEDLGKAMLENAPRLLEIAKAANKLNPALGDTAFLYESVTSGIKRNSKLVLDNLGIVFNQTTAYEEYAKSIGKSTDELTDNERALATLSKVTEDAGQNLLDQAGGLDALTDASARAETAVANLKDELAKGFEPVIADVAEGFTGYMQEASMTEDVMKELERQFDRNLITLDEYHRLLNGLISGSMDANEVLESLTVVLGNTSVGFGDITDAVGFAEKGLLSIGENAAESVDGVSDLAFELENLALAAIGVDDPLASLGNTLVKEYQKAIKKTTDSVTQFERVKLLLKIQTGELTEAEKEQAYEMLGQLQRVEELTQAVEDGTVTQGAFQAALLDGNVTIDEFNTLMGDTIVIADEADRKFQDMQSSLEELAGKYNIDLDIKIKTYGEIPDVGGFAEKGIDIPDFQHGGSFVVPPGFVSQGLPISVHSGEHVQVTPKGQGGAGGVTQNITQNFHDEGAAALGMAVVREGSRSRLNSSMGR
jgi:hypothetical protein